MSAPTCEQVDNVRRLADGLRKVAREWPEHFDMRAYISPGEDIPSSVWRRHAAGEHPVKCGTSGCALGWAPYILGVSSDGFWYCYAEKVLGVTAPSTFESLFMPRDDEDPHDPLPVADRLDAWADRHAGGCA